MADFSPIVQELVFSVGSVSLCVMVAAESDGDVEGAEFFNLTLSSDSNVNLTTDVAVITIIDVDEEEEEGKG